jgi:poly(A) polymerase
LSLVSRWNKLVQSVARPASVQVTPGKRHQVLKVDLSSNAMDTLSRLHAAGFEAYLVGGCVRDLQLGHKPKDFDVVTNATPEQVVGVFRHCRIIGRRFRLAHVFYRGEIIEVSTFRANTQEFGKLDPEDGEVTRVSEGNNVYGTLEEDAWRRDFTVNALYYRLQDASILDYTGGMTDIKNRRLRMIGDPHQRFHEDPVRLLRAIRLAAKLDLKIEKQTYSQLLALPHLLAHVAPARLFDEVGKLFFTGHAVASFRWLKSTGYLEVLFPGPCRALNQLTDIRYKKLWDLVMTETDRRYSKELSLSPGYLLAVLFWPMVAQKQAEIFKNTNRYAVSVHQGIRESLIAARTVLQIPKNFTGMMESIWSLFYRLQSLKQSPSRLERILAQRYVRAGVDFLELHVTAGWDCSDSVAWWRKHLPIVQKFRHSHERSFSRRSRQRRD